MNDLVNGKAPLWQAFLVLMFGSFMVGFAIAALDELFEYESPAYILALSAITGLGFATVVVAWRNALNTPTMILGWLLRFWIVATIAVAFGNDFLMGKKEEAPAPTPITSDAPSELNPEVLEYIRKMKQDEAAEFWKRDSDAANQGAGGGGTGAKTNAP